MQHQILPLSTIACCHTKWYPSHYLFMKNVIWKKVYWLVFALQTEVVGSNPDMEFAFIFSSFFHQEGVALARLNIFLHCNHVTTLAIIHVHIMNIIAL